MEKLLKKLVSEFDEEIFKSILKKKLKNFEEEVKKIWLPEDFPDYYTPKYIGKALLDNYKIGIYTVRVEKELTERTSKREQFKLAKILLENENFLQDAGLFVFYDREGRFRLSLVFKEYSGTKAIVHKRFTFFVKPQKPNRTFIKRILEIEWHSLKDLINTFAVEPLSKEFYKEIQTWFYWAKNKIKFPSGEPEHHLVRLLSRLIFVWFLKEKGLIPDEIFNEEKLKSMVKDFEKSTNYYNAILQNLFFATLNQEIDKRKFAREGSFLEERKEYCVKNLYRYKDLLLIKEEEFINLFKNTPFINGGLFECLDKCSDGQKIYIDGFSRNPKERALIPDEVFFSEAKKVNLGYGLGKRTVRGLIKILSSYDWTAEESTPLDVEVALDPELLGKVFENILAEINPETQEDARRQTGSYYTPKEIVNCMVEESILYLLKEKTGIEERKLRDLIEKEKSNLTEREKREIVKAIANLNVIDPACGSGAFLVGVLLKLIKLLDVVDPDNTVWKEIQKEILTKRFEKILNEEDFKEKLRELEEDFDLTKNYSDFARKLYIIQNSLYGVDIQPVAIELTKLRLFITLLVDQKTDKKAYNLGIKPLPNLDLNFVCADALVKLENSKQKTLTNREIKKLEEEIKYLSRRYFRASTYQKKKEIKERINQTRKELAKKLEKLGFASETAKKIADFDPFDPLKVNKWFDPEWIFEIAEGFDIVIANPPYIPTKRVKEQDKKILKEQYGFADDLYNHFYHRGFELLKENGILTYISSKTFWTIQTKKNLRELLLKNRILKIVDTANPFSSVMVDTCIVIAKKENCEGKNYEITFVEFNEQKEYKVSSEVYKNVANNVFFIPNEFNMKVYEKLGKKVKELIDKYWNLISTSKNIKKYEYKLKEYRENLKEGDITLLGLITEGGQGLATGNNGKYIGVLEGTKYAEKVKRERPEKLWKFIKTKQPEELRFLKSKEEVKEYINSLTEEEIRQLFDSLKEKYGRDIFGQGWLYRIVRKWEIADVESLTEEEKLNGISGDKTFVPYDKGDKEGNRWYAPTPYYIDWSKENVKKLKTDPKARWQGYQFFFREGFCWSDIHTLYIKARLKRNGIHDVKSMSLFSKIDFAPDRYFVCILNSSFISDYVFSFINNTQTFQINDARQIPIIIPTKEQLKEFEDIFNRAYIIQKNKFEGKITEEEAEKKLEEIQKELDKKVLELYGFTEE